ncbi:MAG: diphosphomevalonate decarboxylase [Kofleriaceae bacterium]|nr:diphosphomevalonate decarboxylase [Kofleriaceae bacterium]
MSQATARACANIALVKYWGKRDAGRNLPAAGSLSLTLGALVTETTVRFDAALSADAMTLGDQPARPADLVKISAFLDLVRAEAGIATHATVSSRNYFPTASGLASSASGFAALAVAATAAAGLSLSPRALSLLARRGSGSAARSIFGAFVRMHAGHAADGSDAYAEPLTSPLVDRVRMVIAIVGGGAPKPQLSRGAMDHTAETSPLYRAWLDVVPHDLAAAEAALAAADLPALGAIAEANALAMHASAIAARPAIIYWQPPTLALLAAVRGLRERGASAWATMDAGPHVKVLTTLGEAEAVAAALRVVPGVTDVMISSPGGPAMLGSALS